MQYSYVEHFSVSLFKYFIIKIFVKVEFDICGVWAEGGGVGTVTLRTTNQELKLKLYPERKCCKLLACNICRKGFLLKVV